MAEEATELEGWLAESYAPSYRTAVVLLRNAADAEDAVQEAFLRVWRFRDSLRNRADYRPWLYRVLVNTCYSSLRREIRHRDRRASADALESVPQGDRVTLVDARHDIDRALADLTVDLRTVVLLRYFADLSEREIAIATGRPVGTVKSRLVEARRRIALHPAVGVDADDHRSIKEVARERE